MSSAALAIFGGKPAVTPAAPLGIPAYDEDERAAMMEVADGPLSETGGPSNRWVGQMEEAFCAFTGARYAVGVPNGTTGTRMGLRALGIGPGDDLCIPAYDWLANASNGRQVGASLRFGDIDARTHHMDPMAVERLMTPLTRAVVVTHTEGTAADMGAWLDLAKRHSLHLIEDPAQSLGAKWDGRMSGTIGTFGCYSFNWKKLVTSGDGGVLVTNDEGLRDAVRSGANFGQEPSRGLRAGETASHWALYLGGNERLSALGAATVTRKLRRVPAMLRAAGRNAAILGAIGRLPGISLAEIPDRSTSTYHLFRVKLDPREFGWDGEPAEFRDRFMTALLAEGVPAGFWNLWPISDHPAFRRERAAYKTIYQDTERIVPVDPASMPVTRAMLNSSFVLGRSPDALQSLPEATTHQYVNAIEKVVTNVGAVMDWHDFQPLKPHPPIPGE
jgi:perosamine synthetase